MGATKQQFLKIRYINFVLRTTPRRETDYLRLRMVASWTGFNIQERAREKGREVEI